MRRYINRGLGDEEVHRLAKLATAWLIAHGEEHLPTELWPDGQREVSLNDEYHSDPKKYRKVA